MWNMYVTLSKIVMLWDLNNGIELYHPVRNFKPFEIVNDLVMVRDDVRQDEALDD